MDTVLIYAGLWVLLNIVLLVHELGHAVMAFAVGTGVRRITLGFPTLKTFNVFGMPISIGLFPFMGLAEISSLEIGWIQRMLIAVAGPAASFGFAMLCYGILGGIIGPLADKWFLVGPIIEMFIKDTSLTLVDIQTYQGFSRILALTGNINLILAVLNMLPVPFLDGGRFLFALLEGIFGKWVKAIHTLLIPLSFWAFMIWILLR